MKPINNFLKIRTKMAKKVMIQSTGIGTGAGKSFVVALLCRLFRKQGIKVCPFKTLNLTGATFEDENGEFGYSQALQAISAKIEPNWHLNPFTIKPKGEGKFDLILEGKVKMKDFVPGKEFVKGVLRSVIGKKREFEEEKEVILRNLKDLEKEFDLILVEGAGPSKIFGLGPFSSLLDMVNMGIAKELSIPVIFVTDNVDSIPQTISYLDEKEKALPKGVILNKIPTNEFAKIGIKERWINLGLERIKKIYSQKIGLEILGTLPYFEELKDLPDLDPISIGEKISFGLWEEKIELISEKARKYINLKRIYQIAK